MQAGWTALLFWLVMLHLSAYHVNWSP
jgi:hypothetical protein